MGGFFLGGRATLYKYKYFADLFKGYFFFQLLHLLLNFCYVNLQLLRHIYTNIYFKKHAVHVGPGCRCDGTDLVMGIP